MTSFTSRHRERVLFPGALKEKEAQILGMSVYPRLQKLRIQKLIKA